MEVQGSLDFGIGCPNGSWLNSGVLDMRVEKRLVCTHHCTTRSRTLAGQSDCDILSSIHFPIAHGWIPGDTTVLYSTMLYSNEKGGRRKETLRLHANNSIGIGASCHSASGSDSIQFISRFQAFRSRSFIDSSDAATLLSTNPGDPIHYPQRAEYFIREAAHHPRTSSERASAG